MVVTMGLRVVVTVRVPLVRMAVSVLMRVVVTVRVVCVVVTVLMRVVVTVQVPMRGVVVTVRVRVSVVMVLVVVVLVVVTMVVVLVVVTVRVPAHAIRPNDRLFPGFRIDDLNFIALRAAANTTHSKNFLATPYTPGGPPRRPPSTFDAAKRPGYQPIQIFD